MGYKLNMGFVSHTPWREGEEMILIIISMSGIGNGFYVMVLLTCLDKDEGGRGPFFNGGWDEFILIASPHHSCKMPRSEEAVEEQEWVVRSKADSISFKIVIQGFVLNDPFQ